MSIENEFKEYYIEQLPKLRKYLEGIESHGKFLLSPYLQENLLMFFYRMYLLNGGKDECEGGYFRPHMDLSEYFENFEENEEAALGEDGFDNFMDWLTEYLESNEPYFTTLDNVTSERIMKIKDDIASQY